MVVLKPTAAMRGGSCYHVVNGLYRPIRRTIEQISLFSPQLRSLRRTFVADRAESLADSLSINVLGGTFLAGLQLQGFNVSLAFTATAPNPECRVIRVLYPDLDERTRKLPSAAARARIREHNTGRFAVFEVHANDLSTAESLTELNAAKLAFRRAVMTCVESADSAVRDNLVHVPISVAQERKHLKALYCAGANLSSASPKTDFGCTI
ncbi:MAG: hypothetical protein ACRDRW_14515 [Pseudonocardiaceae bacterium]